MSSTIYAAIMEDIRNRGTPEQFALAEELFTLHDAIERVHHKIYAKEKEAFDTVAARKDNRSGLFWGLKAIINVIERQESIRKHMEKESL